MQKESPARERYSTPRERRVSLPPLTNGGQRGRRMGNLAVRPSDEDVAAMLGASVSSTTGSATVGRTASFSQRPAPPPAPATTAPEALTLLSALTAACAAVYRVWLVVAGVWRLVLIMFGLRSAVAAGDNLRSHKDWLATMREVDLGNGYSAWADRREDSVYDHDGIAALLREFEELEQEGAVQGAPSSAAARRSNGTNNSRVIARLQLLRKRIMRNTFGVMTAALYQPFATGTKRIIHRYFDACEATITDAAATNADVPAAEVHERLRLLVEASRLYGTTALVLNGSIALGTFHLGVVKGLLEAGCLPRVIYGSNTGAIVAATVCCAADARTALDPAHVNFSAFSKRDTAGSTRRKLARFLSEGALMDVSVLRQFVFDNVGDVTFAEAYRRTGRILNILVAYDTEGDTPRSTWLLNHLSTPHVVIATAAVAACTTRGFYGRSEILCKLPTGELVPFDIPAFTFSSRDAQSSGEHEAIERMRQLFNVRFFVISECSLLRLPFLRFGHRTSFVSQAIHFVNEEVWRALEAIVRYTPPLCSSPTLVEAVSAMRRSYPEPNIVLHPASSLGDISMLIRNPDGGWLAQCEHRAERRLWPRLQEISVKLRIELALAATIDKLLVAHPTLRPALAAYSNVW